MKQITFTESEVSGVAKYNCTYTETQGSFGMVNVSNAFTASHTQAIADANHTFSIDNGTLKVEIPGNNGSGSEYALAGNVLTVNNGFTGSITAMYEFTTSTVREIDFSYDHNGLRTQKKVVENGVTTTYDYTLHGKMITHLTKRTVDVNGAESTEELHFFYDAQNKPAFVEYEGAMYRYVHNLQGDIVAIVDAAGNLVVEYKYDAWGKPIGTTGSLKTSLGQFNPFRYRGYVWEEEIELHYLNSRYYDHFISRFINSDCVLPHAILATNGYAYCNNSPIVKVDCNGCVGYCVYLNVYTNEAYNNKYGHYDITIKSSDINQNVVYSLCGALQSVPALTISYGPTSQTDSSAILTFFVGPNSKATFTKQYLIFDDLTQEELDAFIEWLTTEFINMDSAVGNEKKRTVSVINADYAKYSIEDKKYCGSAAAKLITKMRDQPTNPFSDQAATILVFALYMMLGARYVRVGSEADGVYDVLSELFGEAK